MMGGHHCISVSRLLYESTDPSRHWVSNHLQIGDIGNEDVKQMFYCDNIFTRLAQRLHFYPFQQWQQVHPPNTIPPDTLSEGRIHVQCLIPQRSNALYCIG